ARPRAPAPPLPPPPTPAPGDPRLARALPRPVGPAAGCTGHRDRRRATDTDDRKPPMTEDVAMRRGVVTRADDGRQRLEFRRSWSDPIEDVWSALTEPDRLARWIGIYEGERAVGGTGTFTMTHEEGEGG